MSCFHCAVRCPDAVLCFSLTCKWKLNKVLKLYFETFEQQFYITFYQFSKPFPEQINAKQKLFFNSKSGENVIPSLCTSQFQLRSSPPRENPREFDFSKKIRSNFRRCGRNPLSDSQRCEQKHSQMPIYICLVRFPYNFTWREPARL
jgi:hypothetical protein